MQKKRSYFKIGPSLIALAFFGVLFTTTFAGDYTMYVIGEIVVGAIAVLS